MKHFLQVDEHMVVSGYTYSDEAPGEAWVAVDFDASGVTAKPNRQQLVDGALVDTGQPLFPPHHWLTWDSAQLMWVDLRTLDQLKTAKLEEIRAARDAAEYGGFVWDGSAFDSDTASQQRIIGASQLATLTPGFSIDWTLSDNAVRTLNAQEMNQVGMALGQHVNNQHVKGRDLRQQVEAAQTKAEVDAIVW